MRIILTFSFLLFITVQLVTAQTITSLIEEGSKTGSCCGSGNDEAAKSIQVDAAGNIYITGAFIDTADFSGTELISYWNGFGFSRSGYVAKYNSSWVLQWVKKIVGSASIEPGSIAVSGSGASANIYIGGHYTGGTVSFGALTITTRGNTDTFIAQYDANGNEVWVNNIGGTSYDYFSHEGVISDAVGNVYITGVLQSTCTFGPGSGDTLKSVGSYDTYLAKYDINGNFKWVSHGKGSTGFEQGYDVAINPANDRLYVTGYFSSNTLSWGAYTATKSGTSSTYLVCIDSSGTVQWLSKGVSSSHTISYGIDVDENNNIYLTGTTNQTATFTSAPSVSVTTGGISDVYLVKYNSAGTKQWAVNAVRGTRPKVPQDISVSAPEGNVIITGYFQYTASFGGTIPLTAEGGLTNSQDIFIASYNTTNGAVNWAIQGGSSGNSEIGYSVDVLPTYDAYVSGHFQGTATFGGTHTVTAAGGIDIYMGKISLNYLPISLLDFDAQPDNDENVVRLSWITASEINNNYFTVERSNDGEVFAPILFKKGAGNSSEQKTYYDIDYAPLPGTSYYRLKQTDYDGKYSYSKIVSVLIDESRKFSFSVYPNPINASGAIQINLKNFRGNKAIVSIFDNLGQVVYQETLSSINNENSSFPLVNTSPLPAGVYTVSLYSSGKTETQKLIVN